MRLNQVHTYQVGQDPARLKARSEDGVTALQQIDLRVMEEYLEQV